MTVAQTPNVQTFASPLALAIYILDRISGEHRPLVPGLFERALNQHRFPAFAGNATGPLAPLETEQ